MLNVFGRSLSNFQKNELKVDCIFNSQPPKTWRGNFYNKNDDGQRKQEEPFKEEDKEKVNDSA